MMDDKEWKDFLEFLNDVQNGKCVEAFAPLSEENIRPQTWEELIEGIKNLPGDDPITWLPLKKEN